MYCDRHDVLAERRKRAVRHRRDERFNERCARRHVTAPIVERLFEFLHRHGKAQAALKCGAIVRHDRKRRQAVKREIDFRSDAAHTETTDALDEAFGQIFPRKERKKSTLQI